MDLKTLERFGFFGFGLWFLVFASDLDILVFLPGSWFWSLPLDLDLPFIKTFGCNLFSVLSLDIGNPFVL
jgi:hypothetical protein